MNRLKELRQKKKLFQKDLAALLGVTIATYSNWEIGRYDIGNASLLKLAEYYGVTADYILGGNTLKINDKYYHDKVSQETENLVPLLGSVVTGMPIESQQDIEEYIWISQRPKNLYFALRVHGDSMIDAGIHDRCVLIVRKQEYANSGDIVVAMLNGEQTVKRFKKNRDIAFLFPENKKFAPIPVLPQDELLILGKVVEIRTIL